MEKLKMLWAMIIAFLNIEHKINHVVISFFTFVMVVSVSFNAISIFEPPPPEPYKMYGLSYESKVTYVMALSDLFAFYKHHNSEAQWTKQPRFLSEMDVYETACSMITPEMDVNEMKRLIFLVTRINENGCETNRGLD